MDEEVEQIEQVVAEEERDPEREARRRFALAQIRQYPDPVLRMQAREIDSFDEDLARLVERMEYLMTEAKGVGLAANQVGVVRRVFVFRRDRDDETEETIALVNPRIVDQGDELEIDDEGCLSMQGVLVPVERHVRLAVKGRDLTGGELSLEVEGLAARVVQHELDHLDGVLILDRTTPEGRREALAALRPQPLLGAR